MENKWLGNNKTGVAVIRVSTHKQKDSSPEVQEEVIRSYAISKGIKILRFERIVESAKDSVERIKFKNVIDSAVQGNVRHILFYMTDRECRNYTDLENNFRLIKQDKIVLHYAREGRLLWKHSPQSDFLMREFQTLQDKQVSAIISIKVNDAQIKKAEDGWYPGNHPPLGYAHIKMKDGAGREKKRGTTIAQDPNEKRVQQVIREFELRAQGVSYAEIRKQIIKEGFILPSKASGYSVGTIEGRIRQPFYRGIFIWQKKEYKGKHPLIIPVHFIDAIDSMQKRRGFTSIKKAGTFSGGWLKCGSCGCAIVYDPKKKKIKESGEEKTFHYYHCTNSRYQHQSMKGMNVTESQIFMQFEPVLTGITLSRTFATQIAEALNQVNRKAKNKTLEQAEQYEKALRDLEVCEDRIYDDFKRGILSDQGYQRQFRRIRDERSHYTKLLRESNLAVQDAFMEKAETILELAINAKLLWDSMGALDRRDFLNRIVSNPVLDGPTVRFELKKPFMTIVKMNQQEEWRPLPNSNRCLLRERELS